MLYSLFFRMKMFEFFEFLIIFLDLYIALAQQLNNLGYGLRPPNRIRPQILLYKILFVL